MTKVLARKTKINSTGGVAHFGANGEVGDWIIVIN